jgi:putative tryptophan/tyrosine transport system substrate-binding protein
MRLYERAGREAVQTLRIERRFVGIRTEGELEAAFAVIAGERPDALWVGTDSITIFHRKRITDFAIMRGLPTISFVRAVTEDGGLMSYGPDFGEMFRTMATYIDKILKGAKPGDLPVEQPTKFELVINLKTAKALGLTIPPSLLARADQVIE